MYALVELPRACRFKPKAGVKKVACWLLSAVLVVSEVLPPVAKRCSRIPVFLWEGKGKGRVENIF